MTDRDGIRSALQAEFEASTDQSYGLLHVSEKRRVNQMADQENVIQKGLNAAKDVAAEEGLSNQVEELASQLQNATTGNKDEDNDGQPLAAKDGLRYDYDDASDV